MASTLEQTTLSRGSGPRSPEDPSTGPRSGKPSTDNEHSLNNQSQGHNATGNGNNVNRDSGHDTLGSETPAVTGEDHEKDDATGTNPDFSLAGPYNNAQGVYVSPEYLQNDPNYDKLHDEPLWSLAQSFPRVVRPGMRIRGDKGGQVVATQTVCPILSISLGMVRKRLMLNREHRKKHRKPLHRPRNMMRNLGKRAREKTQRIKSRNRNTVTFSIPGVASATYFASSWVNYLE